MRLTEKALKAIDKRQTRLKIALALVCTEQWVIKLIAANKINGPLTKHAALSVIKEETRFVDSEILDDGILTKQS